MGNFNLAKTWVVIMSAITGITALSCVSSASSISIAVDTEAQSRPISPYIYGISVSGGAKAYFEEMGVSVVRWGGNARSRFNWEINASNSGADWYYSNAPKGDDVPGSAALEFYKNNRNAGAESLLTVPMVGWVASDQNISNGSEGVPDAESPSQLNGYDPALNRERTSFVSYARKNKTFQFPPDLTDGTVYQDEWLYHLTQTLGTAEQGGIRFIELGNEPMLWWDTHRDVRPAPLGYDEYLDTFLEYASAVKDVDPSTEIIGPSVWGWSAYFYSALDFGEDRYRTALDRQNHGEISFLPWFLSKVREHDAITGRRSLDYLDVHYYPEGVAFSSDDSDSAFQRRLRSTRSLWDQDYKDDSWIAGTKEGPIVRLIPRLRDWIDEFYPGTNISISEWNWGGGDNISGALATADVLGIMGREGVDLATWFGNPGKGTPVYWAFRMFRNYDGNGSGFGDLSLPVRIKGRQDDFSAYASIDSKARQLKLILINKSARPDIEIEIELLGVELGSSVELFEYSDSSGSIVRLSPFTATADTIVYAPPRYSITMMIADLKNSQHIEGP